MSRSSYTASERRGIIAIGIITLLIIAAGLGFGLYNESNSSETKSPVVVERLEMIDSTRLEFERQDLPKKNKKGIKTNKKSSSGSKVKKNIRKRNPLDEPV